MKLLNYYIENFEPVKKGKDLYGLSRDCFQHLFTDKGYYFVKIQKEVLWNGASVPFLLRWFLPNWDKKDNRYNALSLLHDVAFATKGFFGKFSFEECNDLWRGGLREIGKDRLHASGSNLALMKFSKPHFGKDENNVAPFVTCTLIKG